ncbi:hypothetical protein B0T10DRAFT_607685 [Thelonectria olida]|uniref:Uncharacterized protein n=1 Tax=Thelonectria olida TaxID=1576542 RepID=A0A9P8W076_9HYPO|nr:hypothetical protein B0T10DRAFT_607685 [Thelonectria olida]
MLATTRSARETRFVLHASDTVLSHAPDLLNTESPFNERLENTLEAQSHHLNATEAGWDNTVSYTLAVRIGAQSQFLNKLSPQELAKTSLGVLFGSTGSHGLFFGQIDEITKKPAMFKGEPTRTGTFTPASRFLSSLEVPNSQSNWWVVDIPKQKKIGKQKKYGVGVKDKNHAAVRDSKSETEKERGLWDIMKEPRTADEAKKRFIWLPGVSENAALVCTLKIIQVRYYDAPDYDFGRTFRELITADGGHELPSPLIFPPIYLIRGSDELVKNIKEGIELRGAKADVKVIGEDD